MVSVISPPRPRMPGSICPTSSSGSRASRHEPATKGRLDLEPSGRAVIIGGAVRVEGFPLEQKGRGRCEVNRMPYLLASLRLGLLQRLLGRGAPGDKSGMPPIGVPTIGSGIGS